MIYSNLNSDCYNLLDMRNVQEKLKKAFCYQKLIWSFTVWIKCSSDLKNFENSCCSASNFKCFSRSLEQFVLTVSQNNFFLTWFRVAIIPIRMPSISARHRIAPIVTLTVFSTSVPTHMTIGCEFWKKDTFST